MSNRLSLALDAGLALPAEGDIAVFHPRAGTDLSALPKHRVRIIQPFRPDYDRFAAEGYTVAAEPGRDYAAAMVCLPRAKALARGLIETAASVSSGPIIVDGAKTDGVDSLLKDIRKRTEVSGPVAKAHGKVFWFQPAPGLFDDWRAPASQIAEGFRTAPGVFSADGVDPASAALVAALPENVGKHVVDLGAGWGYLSRHLLDTRKIDRIDLVEADRIALDCARENVSDPRARFHWADASRWRPEQAVDAVVMNPPFHNSRAADPAIGQAFIDTAAQSLKPSGTLWMVANRHLPYEARLAARFAQIDEIGGDTRFKIFRAARPSRARR